MDQTTIQRYQVGGDIYQQLAAQYGTTNANAIASAALTGDEGNVNAAITQAKYGAPLDTSTEDIFANQIITDPLAAPLAGVNTLLSNTFLSFLKSPAVLLTIAVVLFFSVFGGVSVIKRWMNKK